MAQTTSLNDKLISLLQVLDLSVGQIQVALQEGNQSVNHLTESFVTLVNDNQLIIDTAEHIQEDNKPPTVGTRAVKATISQTSKEIHDKIHLSIMAFQFYDRLNQRLDHVVYGLNGIRKILANNENIQLSHEDVNVLIQEIRAQYSTEEERKLFDFFMEKGNIEQAMQAYQSAQAHHSTEDEGDIELF